MMVMGVRIALVFLLILIIGALSSRDARSCNSCGMECETACGTRQFKTCCFNYMRKRSVDILQQPLVPPLVQDITDHNLAQQQRLEMLLARALKSPLYDRFYEMYVDDHDSMPQGRVVGPNAGGGLDRSQ